MKFKAPCLVCGADSSGINFSVRSCKPCGSFYRRCIAERKKYVCRNGNACPIDQKQRQQCRACRLKKCIEVGMSREVGNNPTICAVPPLPETPTSNLPFNQKYPLLFDLLEAWTNFQTSQKSLLKVVHPWSSEQIEE
uniref:Nuclear receptor domain-containing protein n=1 Tax=Panagrolaimus sp. JU765 TaxID=591449 RepID=A0AC34Q4W4_9BILA